MAASSSTISVKEMIRRLARRLTELVRDPYRRTMQNAEACCQHEDAFYFYVSKMVINESDVDIRELYAGHLRANVALVPGLWECVRYGVDLEGIAVEYGNAAYRAHVEK
jgi:hypothetical protein